MYLASGIHGRDQLSPKMLLKGSILTTDDLDASVNYILIALSINCQQAITNPTEPHKVRTRKSHGFLHPWRLGQILQGEAMTDSGQLK